LLHLAGILSSQNVTNIAVRLNSHYEGNDRSAGEDTFPPLVESNVVLNDRKKPATLPSNVQKVLNE